MPAPTDFAPMLTPQWDKLLETSENYLRSRMDVNRRGYLGEIEDTFPTLHEVRQDWYTLAKIGATPTIAPDFMADIDNIWGYPFGLRRRINLGTLTDDTEICGVARELAAWRGVSVEQARASVRKVFANCTTDEQVMYRLQRLFAKTAGNVPERPFLFVDIETTGPHPAVAELIELAIVKTDSKGNELEVFNELFDLENADDRHEIGVVFEELHGISSDDLEGKKPFSTSEHRQRAIELLSDPEAIFIAHNLQFELEWLSHYIPEFWENHWAFANSNEYLSLDTRFVTVFLSKAKRGRLQDFVEHLGMEYTDAHRAVNDVRMMAKAYFKFREALTEAWLMRTEVTV